MKCPMNHDHPDKSGDIVAKEGCPLCNGTGELSEKATRLLFFTTSEKMAKMLMDSQVPGAVSMGCAVAPGPPRGPLPTVIGGGVKFLYLSHDSRSHPEGCSHPKVEKPTFDAVKAASMTAEQVRAAYPRKTVWCPDCGNSVLLYASAQHYIMGDW